MAGIKKWLRRLLPVLIFFIFTGAAVFLYWYNQLRPIPYTRMSIGLQELDQFSSHFPMTEAGIPDYPDYYSSCYSDINGKLVFVIRPGYEYADPINEIRELSGNKNAKVEYAIFSEEFILASKTQISLYANAPPKDDPFQINGIGYSPGDNRVIVFSRMWNQKKIDAFRDHFGIYSLPVSFSTGWSVPFEE